MRHRPVKLEQAHAILILTTEQATGLQRITSTARFSAPASSGSQARLIGSLAHSLYLLRLRHGRPVPGAWPVSDTSSARSKDLLIITTAVHVLQETIVTLAIHQLDTFFTRSTVPHQKPYRQVHTERSSQRRPLAAYIMHTVMALGWLRGGRRGVEAPRPCLVFFLILLADRANACRLTNRGKLIYRVHGSFGGFCTAGLRTTERGVAFGQPFLLLTC